MGRNILKAFLSLAFLCLPILGTQHMVCKTMDDVFATNEARLGDQARQFQGRPGKQGPPGVKGTQGVQGPRGAPAIVDYQRISEILEQKIRQEVRKLNSDAEEFQRDLTAEMNQEMGAIRSELEELKGNLTRLQSSSRLRCQEFNGTLHGSKCYFVLILPLNYNQAVEKCRNRNAFLAEIRTRPIQELLQDFVRPRMEKSTSFLYIGMTYQSSSKSLLFRNGDTMEASQLLWRSGFPSETAAKSLIYIKVNINRIDEGLRNYGDGGRNGVICEKIL